MTELSSLVLFTGNIEQARAFYRAVGLNLDDEDHGDGPLHYATDISGVHYAEHQVRDWGCRAIVEDPDGRPVEINQRGHCAGQ